MITTVIDSEERKEADKINKEEYYEYLIDTYQNLVYSICYKIVNDYYDAEDLAQETFISAYQHLPTFDRKYEKSWICKIATNKCLDYLKHSRRKSIPTEDNYFQIQLDKNPTPEENALEHEVKTQLYQHCLQLKEPYRNVALDYFYFERTAAEISDKTGKNLKTVQTQIYRAKAMLKKKYRKEAEL